MKINDKVFGELEYNYTWSKDTTIKFLGKEVKIALMVKGNEDGKFEDEQYTSYNSLVQNWEQVQYDILQPILDYYKEKRYKLGYDEDEEDENYSIIKTIEELLEKIIFVGIVIPYAGSFEGRDIGLIFDCTWDKENGLGLRLVDEKIVKVGYQDVAI
ncbi:MAG: DUF2004 domain-containing protein [Clostridiaceae bacterium]|jgi:hypothetical protein|nr:DUF2004 domain-containing protein [Clostridiaceae bacterium]